MANDDLSDVQHVRKRPGMYIGETGFFGFIQYLVASVNLVLHFDPSRLTVTVEEDGFSITSDIEIGSEFASDAGDSCFEVIKEHKEFNRTSRNYDGVILNAFSQSLEVASAFNGEMKKLVFENGERKSSSCEQCDIDLRETTIRFRPDNGIFHVRHFSSHNFHSYLKRISFLHPSVCFSLQQNGSSSQFYAPGGIADLFETISTPYQVLHQPIQLTQESEDWKLEAVWAFHSWKKDTGFTFVNNGRAAEGGTHEIGRQRAFDQLAENFRCPRDSDGKRINGIIYAISLIYPQVVWQGCVKEYINNPELESLVCDALVAGSDEWLSKHPEIARQVPEIRLFNFPDIWMKK